jgi:hypothetical protein
MYQARHADSRRMSADGTQLSGTGQANDRHFGGAD